MSENDGPEHRRYNDTPNTTMLLRMLLVFQKIEEDFQMIIQSVQKDTGYLKTVIFYGSSRDSWQFVTSLATASLRKLGSGLAAQDSKETCLLLCPDECDEFCRWCNRMDFLKLRVVL